MSLGLKSNSSEVTSNVFDLADSDTFIGFCFELINFTLRPLLWTSVPFVSFETWTMLVSISYRSKMLEAEMFFKCIYSLLFFCLFCKKVDLALSSSKWKGFYASFSTWNDFLRGLKYYSSLNCGS